MPKVTKIELQKNIQEKLNAGHKVSRIYNIFIDNEYRFSLDENSLVDNRILVGSVIDEERFIQLKDSKQYNHMLNLAFGQIGVRDRSEYELRNYFVKKHYQEKNTENPKINLELVDQIISKLKDLDYINDERFATNWIQQKLASKSKGINLLQLELKKKGISKDIINQVLIRDSDHELEIAKQLVEKKYPNLTNDQKIKQRALGFLMRRGINYDTARKVIEFQLKKV